MPFSLTSCGGRSGPSGQGSGSAGLTEPPKQIAKDAPEGLDLRLSNGAAGAPPFDRARLAPATKLADADANALLARTKPITSAATDQQSFALRPASLPPPQTGQTVSSSFPPPASSLLPPPAATASKSLEVVRYMPEGPVPLAPELSVTFSQPMIAVTSQTDAAATTPVKLTPQPPGRWRWIGTRTILFDPDVRFPQATTYTVEIPAGTQAAAGGAALAAAKRFSFETPPPSIVAAYPGRDTTQRLDVPMFVLFDQKIDPQAVLATISVKAGSAAVPVQMLDAAELAGDPQIAALVDGAKRDEQDGRWLAFRTAQKLPADTAVEITIAAGMPSAEGPNRTKQAQTFSFRTYPPLKIARYECGWGGDCRPNYPFQITFNNELDVDKFDDTAFTITPAIDDLKVIQSGNTVTLTGATAARTRYTVAVRRDVLDQFGQTLASEEKLPFTVGDGEPTFFGASGMVVLDPSAKQPTLDFFSTNYPELAVQLYAVTAADYPAYVTALRNQWNHDKPPVFPGKKVFDGKVATSGGVNQLVETHVDLAKALTSGLGHVIAIVSPHPWSTKNGPAPRQISWVQSTRIGIDAYVDADSLIGYATALDTGKPAAGVALEIAPYGVAATTDNGGLATLELAREPRNGVAYLIARSGNDTAFVASDDGYWNEGARWYRQPRSRQLAWYVTDDRRMYKPGEEVSLKGWLRAVDYAKSGDVGWVAGDVTQVNYQVNDSSGREIARGTADVTPAGGFDTKLTLPKTPGLGYAQITLRAAGKLPGTYVHGFQIEEFRRPEFEVAATASQGPFLVGEAGDVTATAKYFAGGPLPGADVNWTVSASRTSYTPPNRDDYVFGSWSPWWIQGPILHRGASRGGFRGGAPFGQPAKTWNHAAKTDATGAHILHFDFLSASPSLPMSVTANAAITDVNRQTWSASSTLLVHPSSLYVGVKTKKPFVAQGTPFELDVIGVDLDGKSAVGANIDVKVVRLDWEYKRGTFTTKEVDPQSCTAVAADAPSPCSFTTARGGEYRLTATITDSKGRPSQTTLSFWVAGGERVPSRDVSQERVDIIPDKKQYTPGNTAELLVQSPFYPAEGVVTWRRSGIVKSEKIALTGPTQIVSVPITDAMTPNLVVQVDLVGMAPRLDDKGVVDPKLPKRPAYAVGSIDLPIPPKQRALEVTVTPAAAKLGPGEKTSLAVTVVDAAGKPVADAEAAVIVVDEAVLSLTAAEFADPISAFYPLRGAEANDVYSQAYIKLAKPAADMLAMGAANGAGGGVQMKRMAVRSDARGLMPGAAPPPMAPSPVAAMESVSLDAAVAGKPDSAGPAIALRTNFNPLAAFSPTVKTDAAGKATVAVTLPDNLTRYRVVAIAVAGAVQFGKGESAVTARLPLMVRPSPPRFLNFGDKFQLPVVVQNQTDAAMKVRVAVRATNAALTDGIGRELSVPANDRVELLFPAAAELAGTARFQIVGAAGTASDAAELALPVWTPATTEAFATYGVIDDASPGATGGNVVKQPVALPGAVVTQFGGLDVSTSSTNLQALTDAMIYLVTYPFECAEQRASRIVAIAALKDVLSAFKVKDMPSAAAMTASVATDLERLSQMQNADGGFAFWDRGYPSVPFLTVHVANALGRARQKGFAVPDAIVERAKGYLREIERHYPPYYSIEIQRSISAYALYTRKLLGDLDVAKAAKLVRDAGAAKLPIEANGWLLGTLAQNAGATEERKQLVRELLNKVSETAGAASFTAGYKDGAYLLLASDRRADAVILESLIQEQPGLDLIPKLVTGLLGHRKAGRWLNTQENSFALLALDRYFQTYEKATPNFVARVWLGKDYAGEHAFRGRTTEQHAIRIAMKDVASHDKSDLTIQKDGAGRLYYRIGMTYAPASLQLAPADYGFVVERKYEAVDDPKDVTRAADGAWRIKAGARVRVRLTMVNEARRYHVALVDPLPAGLETLNPALAVTGPIPQDPSAKQSSEPYWWWYRPWYEHQNIRDERVEAFSSLVWEGVHHYSYVARATTPGTFIVPPPKAEEMYMPETFGRGASDRVIVE